jgi:DNA-directed RNA polymerase subunit beta'
MPSLLDINEFSAELKEVTSIKMMAKKKFHPKGLFSEQIFGPVRNYTCQCGTYYGISGAGGTCAICEVDIVNSDERRRKFARIILPFPVVNPIFYELIADIGGSKVKGLLDDLMRNEQSILFVLEDEYGVTTSDTAVPSGAEKFEKVEAIDKLIRDLSHMFVEDGILEWRVIRDNLDKLFIHNVLVLPPDLRPAAKNIERNNQVVDQINRYYIQILTKKEIMRDTIVDIHRDKKLFYSYFTQIQKDVNELYAHIISKLAKKEGLIRGNILGKRIDFSGRAVIIPDPVLKLDECVLPYLMFLELFKLQISKKLIEIGRFKLLNDSIDFVDDCIEMRSPVLYRVCEEIAEDEVCLLNRQPSLHRLSMVGFNIKISLDNVIKIHPLACPGFNADFDGDQMAVYIPISEESKQEVREKFLITKNLSNPANESLATTPSQDIILGVFALTNDTFSELSNKVEFKGEQVSEGVKIFNECLPEDYPLINEGVRKRKLMEILNDIKSKYSEDIVQEVLDKIKFIGFKYSTLFGATMSLDSFDGDLTKIKDEIYSDQSMRHQIEMISNEKTTKALQDSFKYSYMIESGARGSWDQVRQIILTRGFISNFKGQILPTPIKHSLLEGLTHEEFFNSTYGCRKGLLDVALNTGASGYLSRKLVFACANLQIGDHEDCGTTDLLEVHVKSGRKANMLINRFYDDNGNLNKITNENHLSFVDKVINIRSPIFCKSPKVCRTCYGDLYKVLNSRFVGVIAAQSLGECNTQLVLRTFHTSGVAHVKEGEQADDEAVRQMDIIGDLATASKLLHKFDKKGHTSIVSDLFDVYNTNRSIHHVHFECVVSQLMWKGTRKWRLLEGREKLSPEFHSVQKVPSYESWLLGLAFSRPKQHILKGILQPGRYYGVMDKILCGKEL